MQSGFRISSALLLVSVEQWNIPLANTKLTPVPSVADTCFMSPSSLYRVEDGGAAVNACSLGQNSEELAWKFVSLSPGFIKQIVLYLAR